MFTDTAVLIDEVIERLETLRVVFADDVSVCRRAGLHSDERKCAEALEGIARLLPRLQSARSTQEGGYGQGGYGQDDYGQGGYGQGGKPCLHCD
jgi:hypothetical protein